MTHGRTLLVATDWVAMTGLTADDRYLMVNPYFHMFGLKAGILACDRRRGDDAPRAGVRRRPGARRGSPPSGSPCCPGAPTIYQSILDHPDRDDHDLSSLRVAVTGAADIPVELIRRIVDELPVLGGRSPATGSPRRGTATATAPDDDPETIATTVGRARPGFELRIVDGERHDVPAGEAGEILLRGRQRHVALPRRPRGHRRRAVAPTAGCAPATSAMLDDDGYLRIVGRSKDMFIVGGFNAYPAEIENALLRHPDVAAGRRHRHPRRAPRRGRHGVRRHRARVDADAADEIIGVEPRRRWPTTRCRACVELVDALPVNATGKVVKDELRAARRGRRVTGLLHDALERAAAAHGDRGRAPRRRRARGPSPTSTARATPSPATSPRAASVPATAWR